MPPKQPEEVSLPQAARLLKIAWPKAYQLLMTGQLKGRQERGRWRVTAASVRRLQGAGSRRARPRSTR